MALFEPILPARYLVPLFDVVAQMRESDRRKSPALAMLDRVDAASSTAVLPLEQVESLLEAIRQLTGRHDLGFEIGRRLTLDHHGALAVWMRRCTSIDQLLRLHVRYSRLITPVLSFDYRRRGGTGTGEYRLRAERSDVRSDDACVVGGVCGGYPRHPAIASGF